MLTDDLWDHNINAGIMTSPKKNHRLAFAKGIIFSQKLS